LSGLVVKPKILHINLARGWRGGEQQTWLLIKELAKRGYEQSLCAHPQEPLAQSVASTQGVDVISPMTCLLAPWTVRCWDLSHAHDGRSVYLAWWLKKCTGLPYILTRRVQQSPKPRVLTRKAYAGASCLVSISEAASTSLISLLESGSIEKVPSSHSTQVPNFEHASAIRRYLMINEESFLIGHAGALVDDEKGQSVLISAVQHLRSRGYRIELVLFGEGVDEQRLKVQAYNCPYIHFAGRVTPIHDYLGALDIFAFPSRHEGLGSILLDAMLAKLPIVASAVGGIPELVKDKKTGLLVNSSNPVAFAEKIEYLLNNSEKASEMGVAGFQLASLYSPEFMADRYLEIYKRSF
jgi:glycosyltransferase involved in cell wall biosynthesis